MFSLAGRLSRDIEEPTTYNDGRWIDSSPGSWTGAISLVYLKGSAQGSSVHWGEILNMMCHIIRNERVIFETSFCNSCNHMILCFFFEIPRGRVNTVLASGD